MARINGWMKTNRLAAGIIVAVVGVMVLGAFLGIAKATDQPSFCGAACHEMGPYHSAWSTGPHKDISCVDCHVDESPVARVGHKFEAMKEVAAHFTGDITFPRETPPEVPDERCQRCHEDPKPQIQGFNHAEHSKGKPCVQCHADAGHTVTPAALLEAGILNAVTAAEVVSAETTKAVVDGGAADLAGHKTVSCSRCHTMSKTACSSCHKPKHKPRGECSTCHQPAEKFVFAHPASGVDCASCHKPPAKHTDKTDCTTCHPSSGKTWAYDHKTGAACATLSHAARQAPQRCVRELPQEGRQELGVLAPGKPQQLRQLSPSPLWSQGR